MKPMFVLLVALAAVAGLQPRPLHAHVVLETKTAPVNSYFRATFMVGHGCSGAATTSVEVTLPDDITVARPQPKPGWTTSIERGPDGGGGDGARIQRVIWTGGPLADHEFDQFEMLIRTPLEPGTRHFKVLQRCGDKSIDWSSIPAPGQSRREVKTPAAHLEIVPAP